MFFLMPDILNQNGDVEMKNKVIIQKVKVFTLSLLLTVGVASVTGYAAEPISLPQEKVITSENSQVLRQFSSRLQNIDRQLASIDALVTRIESAKLVAEKEKYAEELDTALSVYAKSMKESYETAVQQAGLAANSQSKQGSLALLKPFEDLASRHESTLKRLDGRAQNIMSQKSSSIFEPAENWNVASGLIMIEKISDFFVPSANAAIALKVYSACHQNPPDNNACALAIVNGTKETAAAYNAFIECWNRYESVRPKWLRALKRLGCTALYIAKLA